MTSLAVWSMWLIDGLTKEEKEGKEEKEEKEKEKAKEMSLLLLFYRPQ